MNIERACLLLNINVQDINETTIKKQYHIKALEYHPDKCKDKDATEKFKDIKEAYDYLKEHHKWHSEDIYDNAEEQEESENLSSYESLMRYFTGTLEEHLQEEYTRILLEKLLTICEKQAIDIINRTDDRKFSTIYKILTKYKNVFHLSPFFYEEMEKNKLYRFIQGDMKKRRLYGIISPDENIHKSFTDPYIHIPDEPIIPMQPSHTSHRSQTEIDVKHNVEHKVIDSEWDLEIEMRVPSKITKESTRLTETMILKPTLDDLTSSIKTFFMGPLCIKQNVIA